MKKEIITGGDYPIYIGKGLLDEAPDLLKEYKGKRLAIIADGATGPLYGEKLGNILNAAGFECHLIILPRGEKTKCQEILFQLYDAFLEWGMNRNDAVIALGGGVIGDLTGYAAASFMRGLPLIQIPTTLLSQVDSSVGGKVAINLPQGKNLIGTFYTPQMVICDTATLSTLEPREVNAGWAEVIKYGLIHDRDFFYLLKDGDENLPAIIRRCLEIKTYYVEADPKDLGTRMNLNFGHTLGHALETAGEYGSFLHGEAIAIGMVEAARWGEMLHITPKGIRREIGDILTNHHLPTEAIYTPKVEEAFARDKKGAGQKITLVLLEDIGKTKLYPIDIDDLIGLYRGGAKI